jgi:hypothetical protein
MTVQIKIDLLALSDEEVQAIKMMAVKSQSYPDAQVIRDYQKHIEQIKKLTDPC